MIRSIQMTSRTLLAFTLLFFSGIYHAEAKTIKYEKVQLDIAQTEIPFEELLDIGIMLFDPNVPEKEDPMIAIPPEKDIGKHWSLGRRLGAS